jgi:predicted ATPase
MKKYVLTGSSGAGKSCLITALELRNEYVVREAARDYIEYQKANGVAVPSEAPDFEEKILALHILRESRVPPDINRVFLDRGKLDHLAFSAYFNWPIPDFLRKAAEDCDYDLIFLVEPFDAEWGSLEAPDYKRPSRTYTTLIQTYKDFGYNLIRVPPGKITDRVNFILEYVNNN